jgi:hypothetical protein
VDVPPARTHARMKARQSGARNLVDEERRVRERTVA